MWCYMKLLAGHGIVTYHRKQGVIGIMTMLKTTSSIKWKRMIAEMAGE